MTTINKGGNPSSPMKWKKKKNSIPEALVSLENALPGWLEEREEGKETLHPT